MIVTCSCCRVDTGGNHEWDCPNHPNNQKSTLESGGLTGWICPKCGRGLSPYITECPHCPKWHGKRQWLDNGTWIDRYVQTD
jgi:uncharacterized OB-fold protein